MVARFDAGEVFSFALRVCQREYNASIKHDGYTFYQPPYFAAVVAANRPLEGLCVIRMRLERRCRDH